MTGPADRWISWVTTGCVAMLALIAATVSYLHMHMLVMSGGVASSNARAAPGSFRSTVIPAIPARQRSQPRRRQSLRKQSAIPDVTRQPELIFQDAD